MIDLLIYGRPPYCTQAALLFLVLLSRVAFAVDFLEINNRDGGIDLGGGETGVAQHLLSQRSR